MENIHTSYPFRYVSRKQLEKLLDASQDFITTKIRQGVLKPKYIGRKPYFDLRGIERFLDEQPEHEESPMDRFNSVIEHFNENILD